MLPTPAPITVLIADNHIALASGLSLLLERWFQVEPPVNTLGQLRDVLTAWTKPVQHRPMVVVLGVNFGGASAIRALPELSASFPEVRFLMYSVDFTETLIDSSLQSGALGYVDKRSGVSELRWAIDTVAVGKVAVYGRDGPTRQGQPSGISPTAPLTPRLRQALLLFQKGRTRSDVASIMGISQSGVDALIARLRSLYGLAGRERIDWSQLLLS